MDMFFFAFLGLMVGAVVNRLADNLPARHSALDAPQCAYCGTPRLALDQVAVLSYLVLRGKCANCFAPIPLRAAIVEVTSALAFGYLWMRYGTVAQLAIALTFTFIFLLVLVIDLEHRLILNSVILPAILIAALASPWSRFGAVLSLVGGATAFSIVLVIYYSAELYSRLRHLHIVGGAFGQGDVKLAAFMGIVTAFPSVLNALVLTILLGGAGAVAYLIVEAIAHRRVAWSAAIPYGPFFCVAGWVVMVFG